LVEEHPFQPEGTRQDRGAGNSQVPSCHGSSFPEMPSVVVEVFEKHPPIHSDSAEEAVDAFVEDGPRAIDLVEVVVHHSTEGHPMVVLLQSILVVLHLGHMIVGA